MAQVQSCHRTHDPCGDDNSSEDVDGDSVGLQTENAEIECENGELWYRYGGEIIRRNCQQILPVRFNDGRVDRFQGIEMAANASVLDSPYTCELGCAPHTRL